MWRLFHYFCPFCGKDLGYGPLTNTIIMCRKKRCEDAFWKRGDVTKNVVAGGEE